MTKVYVIMSNDYPDRVFANQEDAERYVERREEEEKKLLAIPISRRPRGRIHWRVYPFPLSGAEDIK